MPMLTRLRVVGLVWPTLLSLAALAVLVALGSWQMQRKAVKDGLQGRIAERSRAAPQPLDAAIGIFGRTRDVEYMRVSARGRFLHDLERYIYAPDQKLGPGFHVITPLELADRRVVLVNRGYVTEPLRDRGQRRAGLVDGETDVVGLVRLPAEKGTFTPPNEPAKNLWFWRDLKGLMQSAFPAGDRVAAPFFLDVDAEPAPPGGWPKGGVTEVKLVNRHLEYALTWYGLAATLIGVYGAFAWGRLKGRPPA